jgi:hypothetical protein
MSVHQETKHHIPEKLVFKQKSVKHSKHGVCNSKRFHQQQLHNGVYKICYVRPFVVESAR